MSEVKAYKEEMKIVCATLLDIEGKTEEAIVMLEQLHSIVSRWHLAQVTLNIFFYNITANYLISFVNTDGCTVARSLQLSNQSQDLSRT